MPRAKPPRARRGSCGNRECSGGSKEVSSISKIVKNEFEHQGVCLPLPVMKKCHWFQVSKGKFQLSYSSEQT
ncbi:hypothetical protein FGO68_gene2258 [Halteria grandinella]|uniref:Uncharacterized protein n=1 Tax=Halteria grandinella TaxID=5974 RepID=A0A8J8P1L5_HALGN|nr:hypothetical protein FGO68_gene2258 [Halteria grandinella]